MRILAFLLFSQLFTACQQNPEQLPSATAKVSFSSLGNAGEKPETAPPTTSGLIFRSTDGGKTWQDLSAGLPEKWSPECVYADNDQIILGGEKATYRSGLATAAPVWEKDFYMSEPVGRIFPGRAGTYARSYENGLFQKMPGLGIWAPAYKALKEKFVYDVLEMPDGSVIVGCEKGIFKSADGGNTWKHVFKGEGVTTFVLADGVLLGGGFQGLLRSADSGENWTLMPENGFIRQVGHIDGRFIAITNNVGPWQEKIEDPNNDGTNKLLTSADGGLTWQRMDQSLSPLRFLYNNPNADLSPVMYVSDVRQVGKHLIASLDAGIFRSSDEGKTWEMVLPTTGKTIFKFAISGQTIYAIPGFAGC